MTLSITWVPPVPGAPPGRLTRLTHTATRAARKLAAAVVEPHRASLRRLADMPLAIAGTGLIDWAAYHVNTAVGLLATGLSLWLVEHLVSDDDTRSG